MCKNHARKYPGVALLARNYPFKANKTLQSRDKVPIIILLQSTSAVYGICLPDKQFKKCKLPNLHKNLSNGSVISTFPRIKVVIAMRSYNI
jgi:hypothetical protein